MSAKPPGKRFGWLSDEEDQPVEEAQRTADTRRPEATAEPVAPIPVGGRSDPPAGVPGVARRRRRNRAKNPKALRNDPERMMAGARIRRDVRRRVEQALADPEVGEGTNYSLLVESLLVRWLDDVGYPIR